MSTNEDSEKRVAEYIAGEGNRDRLWRDILRLTPGATRINGRADGIEVLVSDGEVANPTHFVIPIDHMEISASRRDAMKIATLVMQKQLALMDPPTAVARPRTFAETVAYAKELAEAPPIPAKAVDAWARSFLADIVKEPLVFAPGDDLTCPLCTGSLIGTTDWIAYMCTDGKVRKFCRTDAAIARRWMLPTGDVDLSGCEAQKRRDAADAKKAIAEAVNHTASHRMNPYLYPSKFIDSPADEVACGACERCGLGLVQARSIACAGKFRNPSGEGKTWIEHRRHVENTVNEILHAQRKAPAAPRQPYRAPSGFGMGSLVCDAFASRGWLWNQMRRVRP